MAFTLHRREGAGWWVLGVLLALTLGRAATAPRDRWPGLVGDEPTYLMQAESVAWDGDLRFGPEDLERFRARRGHSPEVILQSGDGGAHIVYGKPFLYAVAIAPLVRLLGERGATLANAIALTVAGLLAAAALARQGNTWGPLWITVALFASVAFGHVYWIHPDLFLMCCSACGLAIAHLLRSPPAQARPGARRDHSTLAWGAAGALLAVPGAWRPPYLLILLPGLFLAAGATPIVSGRDRDARTPGAGAARSARLRSTIAFAAGAALVAVVSVGGQELASGNGSPYGGERRGFSELEGFPGVDFPAAEWSARVEGKGNTSWLDDGAVEPNGSPLLVRWNLAYLVAGRTVGLAPYFLPALVGLLRRRAGRAAWLESLVGLAVPLAFVLVRPFNFYGGAGALANRYFLPVFPLFWFAGAGLARCVATAIVAAPFVLPLWLAPAAYPVLPGEGYRYVSAAARRLLPVETTQRHVKAPGRPDVLIGDLWMRFLDGGLVEGPPASDTLALAPGRRAEILIGRASPIAGVVVEPLEGQPSLQVTGPGLSEAASGSSKITVRFEHPTARHPMWWTDDPFWLYRLTIESGPSPAGRTVPLRLTAIADRAPSSAP